MDPDLCTFIKFSKNGNVWSSKESSTITRSEENYSLSKMINAYRTKKDQIVCITQIRCILYNSNMEQLSAKPILDNKLGFIDGL